MHIFKYIIGKIEFRHEFVSFVKYQNQCVDILLLYILLYIIYAVSHESIRKLKQEKYAC